MADESPYHVKDENKISSSPSFPRSVEEKQEEDTFPEGGARAWLVASGCAGVLFSTFGFANSFGVFQEYYEKHQLSKHSPSANSWIGSLQIFFLFSGFAIGGPVFDRYGPKVIWPSATASFYEFALAQGVLAGLSMGWTMAPCMATTSQFLKKNLGAAMGVAVAGSSLGGVIFPIALSKMLNNPRLSFGWTVRICGFINLAFLFPSVACIRARLPPRRRTLFLPSAFKEVGFVSLIGAAFFMVLGVFNPIFYLPSYAVAHGMNTELAFYLTAILNGVSFFGRVIIGIIGDKLGRLNLLCFAGVSSGILALCQQRMTSNAAIIVFAALYGFTSGAIVSLATACLAQVPKSPKNIGTYMGMGMLIVSFGALIGPPINGALIAHYGGFKQIQIFSGAVILAGGLAMLLVKRANGEGFSKTSRRRDCQRGSKSCKHRKTWSGRFSTRSKDKTLA